MKNGKNEKKIIIKTHLIDIDTRLIDYIQTKKMVLLK